MKMNNCGLVALEKITALKNISMFTLIHLAKDNGINLYFCQVEAADLVKVVRPAIFHQKDHFVFVQNGEPLPEGDYTGFVLTSRPPNEPLPFTMAKKIQGQKTAASVGSSVKSAASGAVSAVKNIGSSVVSGIRSAISPLVSAASRAGASVGSAVQKAISPSSSSYSTISPSSASASRPVSSGINLGQMASSIAGGGIARAASNIGGMVGNLGAAVARSPITSNIGSTLNKVSTGVGSLLSAGASHLTSLGAGGSAGGVEIAPHGGFTDTYTGPNSAYRAPGQTGASSSGSATTLPGQSSAPTSEAQVRAPSTLDPGGAFGNSPSVFDLMAANRLSPIGSYGLPQGSSYGGGGGGGGGDYSNDSVDNYSKAAQFLGTSNYGGLPTATREQLNKYANTSIQDLAKEFMQQDDKGLRMLEEKHQQEKDAIATQYANYGQDPYTSSDAQRKLTEIDRQYDQAKSEYQQQGQNQALDKAIQFKKEMLQNSMQQGQFDYNAAMELATHIGRDKELKYALDHQDQAQLQNVLAEIYASK